MVIELDEAEIIDCMSESKSLEGAVEVRGWEEGGARAAGAGEDSRKAEGAEENNGNVEEAGAGG